MMRIPVLISLPFLLATLLFAGIGNLLGEPAPVQAKVDERILSPSFNTPIRSIAISHDNRMLAAASFDGTVQLWDLESRGLITAVTQHHEAVASMEFSIDNRMLASAGVDGSAKLMNLDTFEVTHEFSIPRTTSRGIAISPDLARLVILDDGPVTRLWDVEAGQEARTFCGRSSHGIDVAFSPNGDSIAVGHPDSRITLWDNRSNNERVILSAHQGPVSSIDYSRDGRYLASASSSERFVKVWDQASVQEWKTLNGPVCNLNLVKFSPDRHTLAAVGLDGTVILWDYTTGEQRSSLRSSCGPVHALAFTSDGQTLATGGDGGKVRLWNVSAMSQPAHRQ